MYCLKYFSRSVKLETKSKDIARMKELLIQQSTSVHELEVSEKAELAALIVRVGDVNSFAILADPKLRSLLVEHGPIAQSFQYA